jgi:hypothetical protein
MLDVIDAVGIGGRGGGHVGVEIMRGDGGATDGCAAGIGDGAGHSAGDGLRDGGEREQRGGDKTNKDMDAKFLDHRVFS